jgi:hypothetical protein
MITNILTVEDLKKFEAKLFNYIKQSIEPKKEYLSKEETLVFLDCSSRTLDELRANRKITYTRVGKSFKYKYSSLLKYLEDNSIEAIPNL